MEKILIENFSLRYSDGFESLKNINLKIEANAINVLFGPAGGGKSSLLRTINRLNDLADVAEQKGRVLLNGKDIYAPGVDVTALRRKVGMVFSRPVVLPLSVYDNVAYGLAAAGEKDKAHLDEIVEQSLRLSTLWDEIYDRLHDPASSISGGQQQRLCLARVLALQPEVIMLDEPTSALDPLSTAKIEGLLQDLKEKYTIILAPHNTQQSARLADYAAFFLQGELVEWGTGQKIFSTPFDKRTQDYITGRFG
jgi:phosphate transport system ATP-binding protein